MIKRIVSITDASYQIGLGHTMRQLSIAQAAIKRSWEVVWISTSNQTQNIAHINGIKHIKSPSLGVIHKYLDDNSNVLIDIHQKDLKKLKPEYIPANAITLISDLGYEYDKFGAHIILVGSNLDVWNKEEIITAPYQDIVEYSGRAWMVFRDEFSYNRVVHNQICQNILICHGGSDPYRLTELTLSALNSVQNNITINVLVTDSYQSLFSIETLAAINKHPCNVIKNSKSVRKFMESADLAIINGGNVRYELCLVGTPYIAISIQQKQFECTKQLSDLGIGINIGLAKTVTPKSLSISIDHLLNNKLKRINMSNNMKKLFDLQGCNRILDLMI